MKQEYFLEEIQQNESMSKKYKKFFTTLNYIEHILILTFTYINSYINYWIYLTSCFCFIVWCSYRNYEFYDRPKSVQLLQELISISQWLKKGKEA